MKSWKTTATGIVTIIVALLTGFLGWLKTGSLPDFGAIIAAITAGIGLIAARDNGVTSEAAGAK